MTEIIELASYGLSGACISLVVLVGFLVKKFLCFMKHQEDIHKEESERCNKVLSNHITDSTATNKDLVNSNKELKEVVKELLGFLRKNNH